MKHREANEFRKLLAVLPVRSGQWKLEGQDRSGNIFRLDVDHSAENSIVSLDAGRLGKSTLTTAIGNSRMRQAAQELRRGVAPSWSNLANFAQALPTDTIGRALWLQAAQADITPTLLVLPGISALRSKLPPVDLGALSLPESVASVSLRSIAIDLVQGAIAGTLTFNEAEFSGTARLRLGDDQELTFSNAILVLVADFTYDFASGTGSFWLQSLDCLAQKPSVHPIDSATTTDEAVLMEAATLKLAAKDVWYSFGRSGTVARSGTITLELNEVKATAKKMKISQQVSLEHARVTADNASITSKMATLPSAQAMRTTATLRNLRADFDKLVLAANDELSVEGVTVGDNGGLRADFISLDIGSGTLGEFSAGVAVSFDKATYRSKTGLKLEIASAPDKNTLVFSSGKDLLSEQTGFKVRIARAEMDSSGINGIPVEDIVLNHHKISHQPLLPDTHRTKQITAISDLAFNIRGFAIVIVDERDIEIAHASLSDALDFLGKLADISFAETLGKLLNIIEKPSEYLSKIAELGSFGQFKFEGIRAFVHTLPVRVKFAPEWSKDQSLAFIVVGGIDGLKATVSFSYPSPTLTDWGRRGNDSKDIPMDIPRLELEIGLKLGIAVDIPRRRIIFTDVRLFPTLNTPADPEHVFQKIVGAGLDLVGNMFGGAEIKNMVLDIINRKLPAELPAQWDVSRLTISSIKVGEGENAKEHWVLQFALRFEEHLFD